MLMIVLIIPYNAAQEGMLEDEKHSRKLSYVLESMYIRRARLINQIIPKRMDIRFTYIYV